MTEATQETAQANTTAEEVKADDTLLVSDEVKPEQETPSDGEPSGEEPEVTQEADKDEVTYEFNAPEGINLDSELLGEFEAFAKEKGYTNEDANRLLEFGIKMRQKDVAQFQAQQAAWVGEIKGDKEFGGDALDENLGVGKKALEAFGTPELKNLLKTTGYGNNPEIIRMMIRVGKAISEDKLVIGDKRPQTEITPAKSLYPNMS